MKTITPRRASTNQFNRRWQAVLKKDRRADGTFWYSVKTTGVYCKPSCGARRPLRENVAFHDSTDAAEKAGYRPCVRCKPDRAESANGHAAAVQQVCRLIENAANVPDIPSLAAAVRMSTSHLHRVFKTFTGVTPKAYAAGHRDTLLKKNLPRERTISQAAHRSGFNSPNRLYEASKRSLGMSPSTFKTGGQGATIQFAIAPCDLGQILVAATDRGICSIAFADSSVELERQLRNQFPRARFMPADKAFEKWVSQVLRFIQRPSAGLALPLDIQGTAFQQRVWQALRKIPPGETRTYSQLARSLGTPAATRAVAGACAANRVAVAIPCHRVVGSDGSLRGYRWGAGRKASLLAREKV